MSPPLFNSCSPIITLQRIIFFIYISNILIFRCFAVSIFSFHTGLIFEGHSLFSFSLLTYILLLSSHYFLTTIYICSLFKSIIYDPSLPIISFRNLHFYLPCFSTYFVSSSLEVIFQHYTIDLNFPAVFMETHNDNSFSSFHST